MSRHSLILKSKKPVKSYSGNKSKKVKYTSKKLSITELENWHFMESSTVLHALCFYTEARKGNTTEEQ